MRILALIDAGGRITTRPDEAVCARLRGAAAGRSRPLRRKTGEPMPEPAFTSEALMREALGQSERPGIGAEVQLIAGSQRFVLLGYEGECAVLRGMNGKLLDVNWRCLKPWRLN